MYKWLQKFYPDVLAPTVQHKHQNYSGWAILRELEAFYSTRSLSWRTFKTWRTFAAPGWLASAKLPTPRASGNFATRRTEKHQSNRKCTVLHRIKAIGGCFRPSTCEISSFLEKFLTFWLDFGDNSRSYFFVCGSFDCGWRPFCRKSFAVPKTGAAFAALVHCSLLS